MRAPAQGTQLSGGSGQNTWLVPSTPGHRGPHGQVHGIHLKLLLRTAPAGLVVAMAILAAPAHASPALQSYVMDDDLLVYGPTRRVSALSSMGPWVSTGSASRFRGSSSPASRRPPGAGRPSAGASGGGTVATARTSGSASTTSSGWPRRPRRVRRPPRARAGMGHGRAPPAAASTSPTSKPQPDCVPASHCVALRHQYSGRTR